MDTSLIEKIEIMLKRYDEEIVEIDKNYDKLERLGRYDPYGPYSFKYKTLFLLEYLGKTGADISRVKGKYTDINTKLCNLERKWGKDYRDKLFKELKLDVNSYPNIINCSFDLDPVCVETENALDGRDSMEILMMELREYDLSALRERVMVLDEEFKAKYTRNIRAFLQECPSIEEPYYPDNFWWRHPSKLVS